MAGRKVKLISMTTDGVSVTSKGAGGKVTRGSL